MTAARHYRVNDPALKTKLEELSKRQQAAFKLREKIGRKYGAAKTKNAMLHYSGSTWGIQKFQEHALDREVWRYDKKWKCWMPRKGVPWGKAIAAEMYCTATYLPGPDDLSDILGYNAIQHMTASEQGMIIPRPGMSKLTLQGKDVWFIHLAADFTPKGCVRISDMKFEKLVHQAKE